MLIIPVADGAGGAAASADISRARTVDGAVRALSAAGAELHDGAALRGAHNAVRLCGNQALVVDCEQQHRFHKLRLDDRPAHRDDRLTRGKWACPPARPRRRR